MNEIEKKCTGFAFINQQNKKYCEKKNGEERVEDKEVEKKYIENCRQFSEKCRRSELIQVQTLPLFF